MIFQYSIVQKRHKTKAKYAHGDYFKLKLTFESRNLYWLCVVWTSKKSGFQMFPDPHCTRLFPGFNKKIIRHNTFFGTRKKVVYWGFSVPLKRSLIWLMKKSSSLLVTVAHGRQCRTGSTNPIRWNWNRFRWPRISNKCKTSCLREWSIFGMIL